VQAVSQAPGGALSLGVRVLGLGGCTGRMFREFRLVATHHVSLL
jgi:hypothetical protein